MSKFETELSKEVYRQTYRFGEDKNIEDSWKRVAEHLASTEEDSEKWQREFYEALDNFKFCTAGRILSNSGTGLDGASMINCFVSGFEGEDRDSMESIMDELKRQALILKSEGGYGINVDTLRPRGAYIGGIAAQSPGAVQMLDMWDTQSDTITKGAGKKSDRDDVKEKIRKGAQMVTLSCWHPDVEEFIKAKQTKGRLTKFNMSVLATDNFMEAVKQGASWNLEFPDYEVAPVAYEESWNGDIRSWKNRGLPTKVYKTFDDANELWDIIMKSTYNRNEPGVLFLDRINHFNNLWYEEYINATNPCGEQLLPPGGVCLLGSLNLTQFLKSDWGGWNYDKLKKVIPVAVRMMDNVNDLTYVPLEVQEQNLQNKRRIGLGIMGLGSALMMRKIKYGSAEAVEETENLISFIANEAYKASAMLAGEKGAFPLYDEAKYLSSNFIKNLEEDTIALIKENGIRNSHLLSIQPTGNTSTLANVVSGGLEPVFMHEYVRTAQQPYPAEGLITPESIDWNGKSFSMPDGDYSQMKQQSTEWEWIQEGDTPMLKVVYNGKTWKIDESRGLLKEELVEDYATRHMKESGDWDPDAGWAATTTELSVSEHVEMMKVLAKYIDSAMSKTVNLPQDYPYEDFKDLYMEMYDSGVIKGGTTYRAGTMSTVLASKEESQGSAFKKNDATKRPEELPCHIHTVRAEGGTWRVIVGLLNSDPYDVFAVITSHRRIPEKHGVLQKKGGGVYNLLDEDGSPIIEDVTGKFDTDEQEALTRMISSSLRHGMEIHYIVEQLQKAPGTVVSFNKALARVLSKYTDKVRTSIERLDGCEREDCFIVHQEGCNKCLTCGDSACS